MVRLLYMRNTVQYQNLKVGMICDDWDLPGYVISAVALSGENNICVYFTNGKSITRSKRFRMNIQPVRK